MRIDSYLDFLNEVDEHAAKFREAMSECTMAEFRLMNLAHKNWHLRLNDYGADRSVHQQGIGRIAARLRRKGYVELVPDSSDGRAKHIQVTDEGTALVGRCREVLEQIVA